MRREFPLPKTIGDGNGMGQLTGLGQFSEQAQMAQDQMGGLNLYAPKECVAVEAEANHVPICRADEIKAWLKLLTHREMREFVREIFDAHEQLFPQNESSVIAKSIKLAELADVLDKVAHHD